MKYSIIIVYYYKTSNDEVLLNRCLDSLHPAVKDRTDTEVFVIHDGEIAKEYTPKYDYIKFYCTDKHNGVWGHLSRDFGITLSNGDYIIHSNHDNIFYPEFLNEADKIVSEKKVYIFDTKLMVNGVERRYLSNNPTVCNVDAMQGCIHSSIWKKTGWKNIKDISDGLYIEQFSKEYGWERIPYCIGEHN